MWGEEPMYAECLAESKHSPVISSHYCCHGFSGQCKQVESYKCGILTRSQHPASTLELLKNIPQIMFQVSYLLLENEALYDGF